MKIIAGEGLKLAKLEPIIRFCMVLEELWLIFKSLKINFFRTYRYLTHENNMKFS